MWTFTISTSRPDGWRIELSDVPTWALLLDRAVNEVVCPALGHKLCNPPAWTWKVGWGERYEDDSRDPVHSLGHYMHESLNQVYKIADRVTRRRLSVPVSIETARQWSPDWVGEIEEIDADIDASDPTVSSDAARWTPERAGQ